MIVTVFDVWKFLKARNGPVAAEDVALMMSVPVSLVKHFVTRLRREALVRMIRPNGRTMYLGCGSPSAEFLKEFSGHVDRRDEEEDRTAPPVERPARRDDASPAERDRRTSSGHRVASVRAGDDRRTATDDRRRSDLGVAARRTPDGVEYAVVWDGSSRKSLPGAGGDGVGSSLNPKVSASRVAGKNGRTGRLS